MRTLVPVLLALSACGPAEPELDSFPAPVADADLSVTRGDSRTTGSLLLDDGSDLSFASTQLYDGSVHVVVELHGMRLTGAVREHGAELDGVTISTGEPTLMDASDRAALVRLAAALEAELYPSVALATTKAEYDAIRHMTEADRRLFSLVDGLWAQWPSQLPLDLTVGNEETQRSITHIHYYANNSYEYTGKHDCWYCGTGSSSCRNSKRIGHGFNGCNFANSGVSCSGAQYTKHAANHDQCVRTDKHGGHVITSLWCDDEFLSTTDDELFADEADYDWRDSTRYNNCPSSWDGDGDCDVHCQFKDDDCQ